MRIDLTADAKIDWLLSRINIHDMTTHHEVFRAVQKAYPEAATDRRRSIIEAIHTYKWPNEDDQDKEQRTSHHHYEWLYWLHSSDPDCVLAKQGLDNVLERYPNFKPREHLDLRNMTGEVIVGSRSPFTVEELLARPAFEWLDELLAFQPTGFLGLDRYGLVSSVAEAGKKEVRWGLDLAEALIRSEEWKSDIWSGLMRSWSLIKFEKDELIKVLDMLGREELYRKHTRAVADVLKNLVENDDNPYSLDLLSKTDGIAEALWQNLDCPELQLGEETDWLGEAINSVAGILALYWLNSLSLWRRQQKTPPKKFCIKYHRILSTLVQDPTVNGSLVRSVLASQFAFLLSSDEAWTQEYLLPLFTSKDTTDFQVVWNGFLAWGQINPEVVELLEEPFLEAIERIEKELPSQINRFIEYFIVLVRYFVRNPLEVWIPKLFHNVSVDARCLFSSEIEHHLLDMSEEQRKGLWDSWLKEYWLNRIVAVPVPLVSVEIENILDWLPHLGVLYPEAVEIALKMPDGPFNQTTLVSDLQESELPHRYPESTAKLIIYLGNTESSEYVWYKGKEIIEDLLKADISSSSSLKLKELVAKLGLA